MKNFLLWCPPSKAPFSINLSNNSRIFKHYPKHLLSYSDASDYAFLDDSLRVGFYVTEGFCLIDFDNCFDESLPDHMERSLKLNKACELFLLSESYMHESSSGKGFHIIIKAKTQRKWKNLVGKVEVYVGGRFCATTESEKLLVLEDAVDQSEALDKFLDHVFGEVVEVVEEVSESQVSVGAIVEGASLVEPHASLDDLLLAGRILQQLPADCSNEVWQSLGLAMGNTFRNGLRDRARSMFLEWSMSGGEKFDPGSLLRVKDFFDPQRRLRADGVGLGTLVHMAEQFLGEQRLREIRMEVVRETGLMKLGAMPAVESVENLQVVGTAMDEDQVGFYADSIADLVSDDDEVGAYFASIEELPELNYKDNAQQVAETFLVEGVLKCGDAIFCYEQHVFDGFEQGWWEKAESIDYLKKHLTRFIQDKKFNWTFKGKARVKVIDTSLNLTHVATVIQHVMYLSYDQEMPIINTYPKATDSKFRDGTFVPVQNGVLKIESGELLPYGKDFFNTSILACRYEPKKLATRFLRGISYTFDGDLEAQRVFTSWLGYLLLPEVHAKKILVLNGESDSGKSQLARLMLELVSKGFSAALDKISMGTQFALAGLDRKLIVLMDDFPMDSLTGSVVTRLKQITSGTEQEIQQKHDKAYSAVITAKPVITTNCSARAFEDPEGALMRRVLILNCVRVPEAERVHDWAKMIAKDELAGVLNIAVTEARKLLNGEASGLEQPREGESADLWNSFNVAGQEPMEWFVEHCVHMQMESVEDGYGIVGLTVNDVKEAMVKYFSRDVRFIRQMDSMPTQSISQKIAKLLKRKFTGKLIQKKGRDTRSYLNLYIEIKTINI